MIRPAPGIPIEEQPLPVLRRLLVWAEARGESTVGKLAVLCVAENRSNKWMKGLRDIILQPKQFSSFNADDPNRGKMLSAYLADPGGWSASDAVCELREAQLILDPTKGALHYYAPDTVSPPWGRGNSKWKEYAQIGRHVFGVAG